MWSNVARDLLETWDLLFVLENKPDTTHKSSSPGPSESSTERREAPSLPVPDTSSPTKPGTPSSPPLSHTTCNPTVSGEPEERSAVSSAVARSHIPAVEEALSEATPPIPTSSSPCPGKAVNGLSESPPPSPICEQDVQGQEVPLTSTQSSDLAQNAAPVSGEVIQAESPAPVTQISISPTTLIPSNAMSPLAPPPGLPLLIQPPSSDVHEQDGACGANSPKAAAAQSPGGLSETNSQTNSGKIMATGTTRFFR